MKKILTVIGTRPEIIKMYPLILKLDKNFDNKLIFSGQHFDKEMRDNIFKDLNLRKPDLNINIINKKDFFNEFSKKLTLIIQKLKPKIVIYHGDTLTTLASALVGYIHFPKITRVHIESGYRSNDINSIENRIRILADKMSTINFTIRQKEKFNLKKEGINKNVHAVGNTINDTVEIIKKKLKKIKTKKKYIYVTIHRAENVDNKLRLNKIFSFLNMISKKIEIIVSMHPRTKKMQKKYSLKMNKKIKIIDAPSYSKNLSYLYNSHFCISDSGGLQEEAVLLGKKCFIPLQATPHSYYIGKNSNELINLNQTKRVISFINKKIKVKKFKHNKNISDKICKILNEK